MSDFYYGEGFETESTARGDIRTRDGDDQLAQQMITVAGNVVDDAFDAGTITPERVEEFAGEVRRRLQRIDAVGTVQTVDIEGVNRAEQRIAITIATSLADASATFDI